MSLAIIRGALCNWRRDVVPEAHECRGLLVTQRLHPITIDRIDPEAAKVVRRLNHHGFEAYLVGGCVRDLLLGRTPKDFDVATDATPEQLKALFRNCRIIGRRFRLAHIFFGRKIIETATFRTTPQPSEGSDGLIWQDNEFGTAEQDAARRDFTINGLFYDIASSRVIDAVDGLRDLREGRLRTIGDPDVRLQEDPVRILRAVKFAARLDMAFDESTAAAIVRYRGAIANCSIARVLEEIYRLLRGGSSAKAFRQLHELGILQVLFPEIAEILPPPINPEARGEVPVLRAGRRRPGATPLRAHLAIVGEDEVLLADADPADIEAIDAGPSADLEVESLFDIEEWEHDGGEPLESDDGQPIPSETPGPAEPPMSPGTIDERARARRLVEELGLNGAEMREAAVRSLWARLEALDQHVLRDVAPSEPVLLGVLLSPFAEPALREDRRMASTIEHIELLVTTVGARIHVSRRHRERLKQILVALRRLEQRKRRRGLKERDYFSDARLLLRLREEAGGSPFGASTAADAETPGNGRRRRRRRRRRSAGLTGSQPTSESQPAATKERCSDGAFEPL